MVYATNPCPQWKRGIAQSSLAILCSCGISGLFLAASLPVTAGYFNITLYVCNDDTAKGSRIYTLCTLIHITLFNLQQPGEIPLSYFMNVEIGAFGDKVTYLGWGTENYSMFFWFQGLWSPLILQSMTGHVSWNWGQRPRKQAQVWFIPASECYTLVCKAFLYRQIGSNDTVLSVWADFIFKYKWGG